MGSGVLWWVASLYLYLKSVFLICCASQFLAQSKYSWDTGLVTQVKVLEKDVVFFLVSIRIAGLPTGHKLFLFIIKVIPVDVSVLVEEILIFRMFSQLLHQVKEQDVFIIKASMVNLEGFVPDVWVSHMVRHLSLVSEISVGYVLGKPVLGKCKKFLRDRSRQTSHGCKEGIVFVDMLVLISIRICVGCHEQFLLVNKMVFI